MTFLRFFFGLVVAVLLHLGGTAAWAWFPSVVDPFVVVLVWYGLRSGPVRAQLAGTLTGFVQDALSGGLFGVHAFADTLAAYLVTVASQRVVVGQQRVQVLIFAAASAVQQGVTMLLVFLLVPRPELPSPRWFLLRIAIVALLGSVLIATENRASSRLKGWRRRRKGRLRFD